MNQLHTALERAADKHGAPSIGTVSRRGGAFPALLFGDDHAFVTSSDGYTVYEFDGRSTAVGVYNWQQLGTRDNVLDTMAAHAERYLARKAAPVWDEYSAEWLRAVKASNERIKATLLERARHTAVLRVMQDATAIDDMRAERSAQRYG